MVHAPLPTPGTRLLQPQPFFAVTALRCHRPLWLTALQCHSHLQYTDTHGYCIPLPRPPPLRRTLSRGRRRDGGHACTGHPGARTCSNVVSVSRANSTWQSRMATRSSLRHREHGGIKKCTSSSAIAAEWHDGILIGRCENQFRTGRIGNGK